GFFAALSNSVDHELHPSLSEFMECSFRLLELFNECESVRAQIDTWIPDYVKLEVGESLDHYSEHLADLAARVAAHRGEVEEAKLEADKGSLRNRISLLVLGRESSAAGGAPVVRERR